jgi:hypothetical protein
MAGQALNVESVDEPGGGVTPRGGPAASESGTIYWRQLAMVAARARALERELERERRERQRVIDRYEGLLAERQERIDAIRADRESTDAGLRALLSR